MSKSDIISSHMLLQIRMEYISFVNLDVFYTYHLVLSAAGILDDYLLKP